MCESKSQPDLRIRSYLADKREEMVSALSSLAAIPSVTGSPAVSEALHACAELFARHGIAARENQDGPYLVASVGEGDGRPRIGLFAHCDVVPADPTDWEMCPPFSPRLVGNCLIGRGAVDDKAGIVLSLYAFLAIRSLGLPFSSSLVFFVGGAEEAGDMADLRAFLKNEPTPDLSFVPDGDFPACVGEKTIIHATIRARSPFAALRSLEGGQAGNIVPARAVVRLDGKGILAAAIDGIRAEGKLPPYIRAEQGNDGEMIVTALGTAEHASLAGPQSHSALARLCDFLCTQPALPEGDRTTLAAIARAQQSFDGDFADLVARDETGALTAVIGRAYTDEGCLCYTLDIRAPLCSEPAAVCAALERFFLSHDATLTSYEASPGFYLGNNRFAACLGEIYAALGHKGKLFTMGGGTYARHLPNAFSIGTMTEPRHPSISLPDGRGGEHQSDECLCVDDLLSAAHVLARYLLEADRYLQKANT